MKKIKLNDRIMFSKCRTEKGYQVCIFCGEQIGKDKYGLSLRKICQNGINVWLHSGCIEEFCKSIIKFKEDNIKKLLVKSLE